jgi:hypothetical protein
LIQTGILFPYYSQAVPHPTKTRPHPRHLRMHNLPDQGNPAHQGKRWRPPGQDINLHNPYEEIPDGTKTGISRQYDENIITMTNPGSGSNRSWKKFP